MASRAIQARCRRTEGADARKVRRQHEAACPNPNQEAAAAAREQEATQAAAASLEATQRLRTAMGSGRLALT